MDMKGLMNKLRHLLSVFWEGVTALRIFIANLLFLALIAFLIFIFFYEPDRGVPDGSALIFAPAGYIVDQKTETMLSNQLLGDVATAEILLQDIIDGIDYAKDDQRIKALVLDLRDMGGAGLSKLQDIGAALNRFKDSGKIIIACGDYFNQRQYYLAAHADNIYISPMGAVLLNGYGLYRAYYKSALEKLKIQFHVFKVGTYKTALEPFLRDDMSKEAKESNLAWLNELWSAYKADVATLRGLDPSSIDDYINHMPTHLEKVQGDTATLALAHGLVDGLKTRDEVQDEMIGLFGKDRDSGTIQQIDF